MKQYQIRNTVTAQPMTRGDYNNLRGWALPADEDPNEAGFLVINPSVSERNLEGYDGYVSWLPQEAFAELYRETDTWKQRLEIEAEELNEKIDKLSAFINGAAFNELPKEQQELLAKQLFSMAAYNEVLKTRLAA
ncbi:TPA: hypothetical protein ACFNMI_001758 [Neisseria bacilliformis]|jgi:hypothetical protein|uniref:crAss001_48 related protein n=1 Tax=Neisseria bacilliformis TaxID=267212 RepID=UPI0035F85315